MTTTKPPRVVSAAPRLRAKAQEQRRATRRRLLRRTGWTVVALAPLAAGCWLLLGSQLLALEKVSITGTERVTTAQVRGVVDVAEGMPLARVDTSEIVARLQRLPPVASASVERNWPHELRITIVERVVVAAQRQGSSWVLRDYSGAAVATVRAVPPGAVPMTSPNQVSTTAALTVLRSLPPALKSKLGSLQATSAEQVTLVLKDGRRVLWGGASDNAVKASAVLVLLKMPGTVFDVSAKGVVTRR